jgi:hypothetical protein
VLLPWRSHNMDVRVRSYPLRATGDGAVPAAQNINRKFALVQVQSLYRAPVLL